jgi:enoyl-CoA hydratase
MLPWCKAAEIALMGRIIDAQEAYRIGLINKVVSPGEVMTTAREWADVICRAAPLAVRAAKEAMIRGYSMTLEEGLRLENTLEAWVMDTEDFTEGITAFVEKRKPVYKAK